MYKVTTAATGTLISLDMAKKHLRIETGESYDNDDYITLQLAAAISYVENKLHVALMDQSITEYYDRWASVMPLQIGPVKSLTSVKYLDVDGAEQTYDNSNWLLSTGSVPNSLTLKEGLTAPNLYGIKVPDAVRIEYVAGHGVNGETVPKQVISAILLKLASMEANSIDRAHRFLTAVDDLLRDVKNQYARV